MYTLIVSPGYYLHLGDVAMVSMFGVMFAVTIVVLILSYIKSDEL